MLYKQLLLNIKFSQKRTGEPPPRVGIRLLAYSHRCIGLEQLYMIGYVLIFFLPCGSSSFWSNSTASQRLFSSASLCLVTFTSPLLPRSPPQPHLLARHSPLPSRSAQTTTALAQYGASSVLICGVYPEL